MGEGEKKTDRAAAAESRPHRVRIPGFVSGDEEVGLGDVIKRVTYAMGVRHPCGGCERRAAALNQRVTFSSRRARR
ncbi:hypothetical protein ACQUSR_29480 [Streptomyces sp. P1-3]|uniref:hypothetical protein n=1 Tax=Streptomyces sp. P1-3 TaxID=3421658 RepID=UPI003D36FD7F